MGRSVLFCRAVFCIQILQTIPCGVGPIFLLRSYDEYEEWILTTENYALPGAFICEYKARERIHRGVADPRLLVIPAS